jgi:hypothetical protein
MLIVTSFLYIVGNLPYMLSTLLGMFNIHSDFQIGLLYLGLVCIYSFPALKLFVYFYFNKLFRDQCLSYLRTLRRLVRHMAFLIMNLSTSDL